MAADFFVVPTITFRLLYVLVILAHERRRIVHVAVTEHPTAPWPPPTVTPPVLLRTCSRSPLIARSLGSVGRDWREGDAVLADRLAASHEGPIGVVREFIG